MRVFTDGACKSNGKVGASASYAGWFPEQKEWSFATKMPPNEQQTNQRAELKAIHDSVKIVYEKSPLDISLERTNNRYFFTKSLRRQLHNLCLIILKIHILTT